MSIEGKDVTEGRATINEWREQEGLPRLELPQANRPLIIVTQGVVFVDQLKN